MNEKPEIEVGKLPVITKFIYTLGVLPTSYLMSMTYQEQVTWLYNYLQTQVIPLLNTESAAIQELQTLYELLRTYVNDYFDNLDVQEEVNTKLDEMVSDGTLQEIISVYLDSIALFTFDNVEEMKKASNLINGSYAKTLGYYEANDGGSATYKIRNIIESDIIDEMLILSMENEELCAEIILNQNVNSKQLGLKGDDSDESDKIEKILNIGKNVTFLTGSYLIKKVITISNCNNIYGTKNSILNIVHENTSTGQNPNTSYGLHFVNNNNFEIKDIIIKDSTPNKGRFSFNFTFENCHFVNIENVEVDGNCGSGMLFWKTCSDVIINNCYVHDTYSDGIHLQRGSTDFKIINNKVLRTQDDCIGLNTFDYDTYGKSKRIIVEGNYLADSSVAGSGVAIIGVDDITVKNNIIYHTYYGGIRIANNTADTVVYPNNITIENNQILYTGYGDHLPDAIYCNYASNLIIVNNIIEQNINRGMALSNLRGNNIIKNNIISNVERGIIATCSTTNFFSGYNVIVNNNILKNIGGNPIQITGNTGIDDTSVFITNNIVYEMNINGTASVGISSTNQKNLRILNNIINTTHALATPNNYYQKTNSMANAIIHGNYPILNTRESSNFGTCTVTTANSAPSTGTAGDICINGNAGNASHIAFWYCTQSSTDNDSAVWKEVNFTV